MTHLLPQKYRNDNWHPRIIAGKTRDMLSDPPQTWEPFYVIGESRPSRWLILCDHATNVVPDWIGHTSLGLPGPDMQRHIAFDIGAAGLTQRLADLLDAPAICANFSRLVIDPNRGEDDPTLVRRLYDETIIPANRHIGASDIEHRLERCYRPYHAKIAEVAARREDTVVIAVHSFTPRLRNRAMRPWHVGLLFAEDDRLSRPLMALLGAEGDLVVGENEPYPGYLKGDTIDRHASLQGRQNTLIEIRNDLIADEAGQTDWAARLARLLPKALEIAEEKGNENYGRQDKDRA